MMGTKARDFTPLVAVSLDDLVPAGHFYRHLERALDLTFVRDLVQEYYKAGGRPSIGPIVVSAGCQDAAGEPWLSGLAWLRW